MPVDRAFDTGLQVPRPTARDRDNAWARDDARLALEARDDKEGTRGRLGRH
jgi:hypothetical protein